MRSCSSVVVSRQKANTIYLKIKKKRIKLRFIKNKTQNDTLLKFDHFYSEIQSNREYYIPWMPAF